MTDDIRILLVDDDPIIIDSLGEFLRIEGYQITTAQSAQDAMDALKKSSFNLVLSDINLPDHDGFQVLRYIKEHYPQTVVILVTGYGTIESAVEAIKLGAYDYLTKPVIDDDVKLTIQRALAQQALLVENTQLREELRRKTSYNEVVGHDYKMSKIFDLVDTVADSKITVLITGESGTGKSMLARAVHRASERKESAFVEVSCGAIPESLLESELFGHVKGAFTGATTNKIGKFKAADGGTLFLDEIATASASLQVKLLRVLQERQFEAVGSTTTESVDVRVILATNVDLEKEVAEGRFRQDLYYRVNVVNIVLPPLKERLTDIALLAKHFIGKYEGEVQKRIDGLDDEALRALQHYNWPGNVRELENVIQRAVVFAKQNRIKLEDLPPNVVSGSPELAESGSYQRQSLQEALEEPERRIILAALQANDWNRQLTADELQINRTTLYKKIKKYNLIALPEMTPDLK